MKNYEVRVQQLNRIKFFSFLKLSIFIVVFAILLFGGYFLLKYLEKREIIHGLIYFVSLYFALITILIVLSAFLYSLRLNKIYLDEYKKIFLNECKLEEIYLLDNNIIINQERDNYLKKIFFLKKFYYLEAYSDATSERSFDIYLVRYNDHVKTGYGMIFISEFNVATNFFFQICDEEVYAKKYYENEALNAYGFASYSLSDNFYIYASGNKIYDFMDNGGIKSIIEIDNYFNHKINLVFDDEHLLLFVKDLKMTFVDGIFHRISSEIFEKKILSMRSFHEKMFALIKNVENVFISKDGSGDNQVE